jgi:hypothetical protein
MNFSLGNDLSIMLRHIWELNVKMGVDEILSKDLDWIYLAEVFIKRRAFVNTVMNLQLSNRHLHKKDCASWICFGV